MRRNKASMLAVFAATMMLPFAAVAQSWPEAHTGAYLGVQISAVAAQQVSALKLPDATGALITYVDQDGPACHAGLMERDVVVAYEGSKVDGPQQLQNFIHSSAPQKTVTLTIYRAGQRKDMKVTLGSWNVMSHVRAMPGMNLAAPPLPRVFAPDVEVPSFVVVSSRHGLVVESLTPQLADFFGVPHGRGVLVRSVESGSPASAAGLKAGDVVLKVNNEDVHDMADWQRGMHASGNRIAVSVWREKREQSFVVNVPGPRDSSRLTPGDWLDVDTNAQLVREELQQLQPEIVRNEEEWAKLSPTEKDMEQLRREMEKTLRAECKDMKPECKDIRKLSRDLAKSAKPLAKDTDKLRVDLQKSLPSQQDIEKMTRQAREAVPSDKAMEDIRRQIQASMPTQKQLDEMRTQVEDSMKNLTPELQKQMEEMRKQMEQQKLDLQKMMQELKNRSEF